MGALRSTNLARGVAAFGLIGLLVASGCSRKAGGFQDPLDEARFERDQLEIELRRVTAERNELRAKLDELTSKLEAVDGVPAAVVIDSMPRCAGIRVDRLTGLYDRDGEPGFEGINVYLLPFDSRDRFVQISGTLNVVATLYPMPGSAEAERVVARRVIEPKDLREAYRSTLLSTHYSVPLAIGRPITSIDGTLVLLVQFRDVLTGQTHSAEKILEI